MVKLLPVWKQGCQRCTAPFTCLPTGCKTIFDNFEDKLEKLLRHSPKNWTHQRQHKNKTTLSQVKSKESIKLYLKWIYFLCVKSSSPRMECRNVGELVGVNEVLCFLLTVVPPTRKANTSVKVVTVIDVP